VLLWQSSPGCGNSTLARAFGSNDGQADPHLFAATITCGPMASLTGTMLTWTTNVLLADYALMSDEFKAAAPTTELVLLVLDARKITVLSLMQTLHECGNFANGAFAIIATHAAEAPPQALKDLRDCLSVRPMKKLLVLLDDARDAVAAKAGVTKALNLAFQRAIKGEEEEDDKDEVNELDAYMDSDDEAALPRERPLRLMLLGEPRSGRSTVARSAHDGVESDLGLPNSTGLITRFQMSTGGGHVGTLHLLDQEGTDDFAANFADVQASLVVVSLAEGVEGVLTAADRVLSRAMQAESVDDMHDILVLATHKDAPGAEEAFAALKAHLQGKGKEEECGNVGERIARVDARDAAQVRGAIRRLVRAVMTRQAAKTDGSASGDEADEIVLQEARVKVAKADRQRAALAAAKQRESEELQSINALMDQLMPAALDAIGLAADQAEEDDKPDAVLTPDDAHAAAAHAAAAAAGHMPAPKS